MFTKIALFCSILPLFAAQNTALVASLSGSVTLNQSTPVSAFDWLPDGAVLETKPNSAAVVILLSGRRFELGPNVRASIKSIGVTALAGQLRELDPLPPIPKPAPLTTPEGVTAAVRIRSDWLLYPRDGMIAIPGPVKLSFDKIPGALLYQVVVEDQDGNTIASEQTQSDAVTVTLQPSMRYSWRVRALGPGGVIKESRASFSTMSAEEAQTRQTFADAVLHLPGGLALLASVDLETGLVREAVAGFEAALRETPDDPARARALAQAKSALAGKKP